jgi:hypothetical protein
MVSETETPIKPDMVAVLERTHVSKDLHGFCSRRWRPFLMALHVIDAAVEKIKDGIIVDYMYDLRSAQLVNR